MITRGLRPGAQPSKVRITPFFDVEWGDDPFVPFYLSMVPIFMIDANDSF